MLMGQMKDSPEDARLGCQAAAGCESATQAWPSWAARRDYLLRAGVSWQGQVKGQGGCAYLRGAHQALSCLRGIYTPLPQGHVMSLVCQKRCDVVCDDLFD